MARLEEKLALHANRRAVPQTPLEAAPLRDMLTEIPLHQIEPDPDQPRKELGDLTELKSSIQAIGIAQPIVVRVLGYERYQIIMGERRYTAAKELGLAKIPAIVRNSLEEHTRLKLQIVENLHRKDLNPLEEAAGYQRLILEFGLTQEQLGQQLGKSQNSVSETLRLLQLSPSIQEQYRTSDTVSKSLLLEIAKLPNETQQMALWNQAKRGDLTVKKAREQKGGISKKPELPIASAPRLATVHLRYPIQTQMGTVTIAFEQAKASQEDIVAALREALETEEARLHAINS